MKRVVKKRKYIKLEIFKKIDDGKKRESVKDKVVVKICKTHTGKKQGKTSKITYNRKTEKIAEIKQGVDEEKEGII